jgi:hypothetical protein
MYVYFFEEQPEGWADRQRSLLTSLADVDVLLWTGS